MTGFHRHALKTLVVENTRSSRPAIGNEVWNLNLDQIESDTGRVLAKLMVPAEKLGPSTYPFDAGTVLYSKLRPYLNKVVVADQSGVATTELVSLRCDPEKLLPHYLAHFLRSPEFLQFANIVVAGAKMPRMVMSEFWDYKIPLPHLPEQRRIAAILDQADALRAKRREALAQLDSLTQSIFVEMFGDPVTNPKGWPCFQLGEIIESGPQNGLYKPSTEYGSGTPILRIDAFYGGVVTKLASLKRVRLSVDEVSLFGLHAGDIVINRVNSLDYLGKSALIPSLSEPTVFESNMMRFAVQTDIVEPIYLVHLLQTTFIKGQILASAKNAVNQSSINQTDVKSLSINLPSITLQRCFSLRSKSVESLRIQHLAASAELDSLFSSLQHRAFRGEL